jgi:hypothetical protein
MGSLEGRFALRIAAALSDHQAKISPDIAERLRFAREQAIARAMVRPELTTVSDSVVQRTASGAGLLAQRSGSWIKLGSVMPLIVLVAGMFLIDHRLDQQQINAAAEVDSALLADDLPPAAYSDPGFLEFLKTSPN